MLSNHYVSYRNNRNQFIKDNIGYGHYIEHFCVDKGHKDGKEIHSITSTGLIIITNRYTHKLVTILIARVAQIKRYYYDLGRNDYPNDIIDIAYNHELKGWNNI